MSQIRVEQSEMSKIGEKLEILRELLQIKGNEVEWKPGDVMLPLPGYLPGPYFSFPTPPTSSHPVCPMDHSILPSLSDPLITVNKTGSVIKK